MDLKRDLKRQFEPSNIETCDKVRDTKMMMNTVRNSIYYLLYVYHNMYK